MVTVIASLHVGRQGESLTQVKLVTWQLACGRQVRLFYADRSPTDRLLRHNLPLSRSLFLAMTEKRQITDKLITDFRLTNTHQLVMQMIFIKFVAKL